MIRIQHLRHATSIIEISGKVILLDPLFSEKDSLKPIPLTNNRVNNPLVELPDSIENILKGIDGVFITHNHIDHIDKKAVDAIGKNTPVLCQSEDLKNIRKYGLVNATGIDSMIDWLGLKIYRNIGSHGGGILKKALGISSSYFIRSDDQELFITGDTLLTKENIELLIKEKPNNIIAYGGGATMLIAGKITMDNSDIVRLSRLLPESKIVVTHMEAINHCFESRAALSKLIEENNIENIVVPDNGSELYI